MMGFVSWLKGLARNGPADRPAASGPQVTFWLKETRNLNPMFLTSILVIQKANLPAEARAMLERGDRSIRFVTKPNPSRGGTDVTCYFE